MTQNSCRGSANVIGVVLVGQREIERMQRTLAAFVVLERVDRRDPRFDFGISQFLNNIKEVLVELRRERVDVLIDVQKLGDEATRFARDWRKISELLRRFPEHVRIMTWVAGKCKGKVGKDREVAHKGGCLGGFGMGNGVRLGISRSSCASCLAAVVTSLMFVCHIKDMTCQDDAVSLSPPAVHIVCKRQLRLLKHLTHPSLAGASLRACVHFSGAGDLPWITNNRFNTFHFFTAYRANCSKAIIISFLLYQNNC
ncbi:MAG: hypothetical protein U0640_00935 [Phycisphaerales bacterium]